MKSNAKAMISVFIFTGMFLAIFPAFLDRWPTIFGIACVFLMIPQYLKENGHRWNVKLLISIVLCGINMVLILVFCDKGILAYQIAVYLAGCAGCLLTLVLKRIMVKRKKEEQ